MTIERWLEKQCPRTWIKFQQYCYQDELYDHSKSIYNQDLTMLIGIIYGFLNIYNIETDSVSLDKDMINAFRKVESYLQ